MDIRKTAMAAMAFSMACFPLPAATPPGELVTHLFPHMDGESKRNGGANMNDWIEVGRNGTVGWITYKTGGVDLNHTTGSSLTLYIDKVYTGGTIKVFALTQALNQSEMTVEGRDLAYNSASPVASATVALGDEEKILRINLGNLLNQGAFNGLVVEAVGSARVDFGAKESPVQPLIELRYAFATAAQVQQAIDAGLAAQAAAAAAQQSADDAAGSAAAADGSAISAQAWSDLAGQHAGSAAASAGLAAGSVLQAQGFSTQAGIHAGEAFTSAGQSAGSATASAGSATASAGSAGEAAQSAISAGLSAEACAHNAALSGASAAASGASAGAAAGSAATAVAAAGDAAGSAAISGASAGEAAGSAAAAGASAGEAAGSAQQAGTAAGACATYAGTAQDAAASAAASAAAAGESSSGTGLPTGISFFNNSATPPDGFVNTGIRINYETPWGTCVSMPGGRYDLASAVAGGKLYAMGGYNGGFLNANLAYDPVAKTWTSRAPIPLTNNHVHTLTEVGGMLYSIAGFHGNNTLVTSNHRYDPVANTWSTIAPIPNQRFFHAAEAVNGKIYVFGGFNTWPGQNLVPQTNIYDVAANTWSIGASIPTPRGVMASAVVDGKIHLMGGSISGTLSSLHHVYDPATNTWSTAAPLPSARSGSKAVSSDGRIYVFGGSTSGGTTTSALQYDPSSNTWLSLLPLATGRYQFAIGLINGKVTVSAGRNSSFGILSSTEDYVLPKTVYLVEKN